MNGYKQNKRPLRPIKYLLFMLFLFPLAFAQPVFASATQPLATPTPVPTAPSSQGFALARVSVVRLLVSYTDPNDATKTVALCTGLGVVVKSLPPTGNKPNDLVLTDAFLVDKTQVSCVNGQPAGTLSQVQISFNTKYNSQSRAVSLDSNSLPTAIACSADPNCSTGLAVIAFHGDPVPFVDVAASSAGVAAQGSPTANADRPLGLTGGEGAVNFPAPSSTDVQQYPSTIAGFLTPQFVDASLGPSKTPEAGTPFIESDGLLTRLQSASGAAPVSQDSISTLINNNAALSALRATTGNSVNSDWKLGIAAFYTKNYDAAQADFQQAVKDNPNSQGAKDFVNFTQNALNPSNSASSSQQTGPGLFTPSTNIFLGLCVAALVLSALLLLLTSLPFGPRVRRRRAFKADWDAAGRRALIEDLFTPIFPTQQQALQDKTVVRQAPREIHCPNCGEVVMPDANYCPNCRQLLRPSESGLHRRIRLPASPQPSTVLTPRVEFDATDIRADINARQLME